MRILRKVKKHFKSFVAINLIHQWYGQVTLRYDTYMHFAQPAEEMQ